eukprot:6451868-Ditylum_brightwellii.AAC.1
MSLKNQYTMLKGCKKGGEVIGCREKVWERKNQAASILRSWYIFLSFFYTEEVESSWDGIDADKKDIRIRLQS